MAKDWINRHPKLIFLLIGVVLMLGVVGVQHSLYDEIIEDRAVQIKELKTTLVHREATINTLTEYSKRLEKSVKTMRVVSPDGTIKEVTESDTKTETDIRNQVVAKYEEKIKEDLEIIKTELYKKTSKNNKLKVLGGVTTSGRKYLLIDYNVLGPMSANIGVIGIASPEYSLGIGWEF